MITLTIVHGSNDNKSVYPKGTSLNVRSSPSITAAKLITVPAGINIGTVQGEWTGRDEKNFKWYVIKLVKPVNGKTMGSVREDVIRFDTTSDNYTVPNISDAVPDDSATSAEYISKTEMLVKNVAAIDVIIYKRLILIYYQLKRAESLGIVLTKQKKVFDLLVQKYKIRQKLIKSFEVVKTETPAYPLYKWISDKFGLGVIQIPAAVIIAVFTIATLATAYLLYKAFAPAASGQADDLKITGEFQKFFEALPADKQALIKADLNAQLKDAYNKGASDSGMSIGDIFKWGAAGLLLVVIYNQFQEGKQKREIKKTA